MDLGIKGRVALITGGNRGIGLATAKVLVEEGCQVAICGRSPEKLAAAAREVPGILTFEADTTAENAADLLVSIVEAKLGPLDILVNNAGGSLGGGSFSVSTDDQWRKVFELNLFSILALSRRAATGMAERGWGRIVHISSIYGKESGGGAAYNASKAALISLSKAMAVDLAPRGVLVNCIAPGSVLFEGGGWAEREKSDPERIAEFVQRDLPLRRFGTPEEVAGVIAFAVSERAGLLVGSCFVVDGGQSKSNL